MCDNWKLAACKGKTYVTPAAHSNCKRENSGGFKISDWRPIHENETNLAQRGRVVSPVVPKSSIGNELKEV